MVWTAVLQFWWMFLFAALALFLSTPTGKGIVGELYVALVARFRLAAKTYHRLHNVTVPALDGTTQIDHVIVSPFGVFVIETKNMKGWIYGSERDAQWTQAIYGHKQKFQNPLRQNHKHTQALVELLDVPPHTVHSVIAFVGEAKIKTELPSNVTVGAGFIDYVRAFKEPVFTDSKVELVLKRLKTSRLPPTLKTHRAHVQHLQRKYEGGATRACPDCGNSLTLRTESRGAQSGKKFWMCNNFPDCRHKQPAEPN